MRRVALVVGAIMVACSLAAIAWSNQERILQSKPGQRVARHVGALEQDRRLSEDEKKREARFEVPVSSCGDFGKGAGPQLCLERVTPESSPLGRQVELRLRWRNIAPNQRIRVRVTNAAPVGTRYRYRGPSGSITADLFGETASGDELIPWDGKSVYCAPADAPMMCDAGEVGRYRIEALLFTGDDPFWPSWPPPYPNPTVFQLRSEAPEVEFTGLPRPFRRSALLGEMLHSEALRNAVPRELGGAGMLFGAPLDKDLPVYKTILSYCADLPLDEPLAGRLSLCFPRSARDEYGLALRRDDVTVHGRARMAPGIIPAKAAEEIAARAAIRAFRGRYDFDHYPTDEELKERFGPAPRDQDHWRTHEDREAAQKAWGRRIVYLRQEQTYARFLGDGLWLVSVDQVATDMAQEPRSDFLTYYYRIGSDRRPCLIAVWNRNVKSSKPPRREEETMLPCQS